MYFVAVSYSCLSSFIVTALPKEHYDTRNNILNVMNSSMALLYIEYQEYVPNFSILAESEKADVILNFVTNQKQ